MAAVQRVGEVTGYDLTTDRAAIRVTDQRIQAGDRLVIVEDGRQVLVEETVIFQDEAEAEVADPGEEVLIRVPDRVHLGDPVFKVPEAGPSSA